MILVFFCCNIVYSNFHICDVSRFIGVFYFYSNFTICICCVNRKGLGPLVLLIYTLFKPFFNKIAQYREWMDQSIQLAFYNPVLMCITALVVWSIGCKHWYWLDMFRVSRFFHSFVTPYIYHQLYYFFIYLIFNIIDICCLDVIVASSGCCGSDDDE